MTPYQGGIGVSSYVLNSAHWLFVILWLVLILAWRPRSWKGAVKAFLVAVAAWLLVVNAFVLVG